MSFEGNKAVVNLQFALMSRKGFCAGKRRTRKDIETGKPADEKFLDALFGNIRQLGLDSESEDALLAVAAKAYGAEFEEREDLCLKAIGFVEEAAAGSVEMAREVAET
jgi:hypothetical protein